jgi:hypothetical protein
MLPQIHPSLSLELTYTTGAYGLSSVPSRIETNLFVRLISSCSVS